MMKKRKITIGIISCVVIIIIASICYSNYNKKQTAATATVAEVTEPVYNLIKVQYFQKGNYNDYKALLTSPSIALPQKQFAVNQKANKPNLVFKYDSQTPESIRTHLKAIEQGTDGNTYRVYYLQNVNNTKDLSNTMSWVVTKKNGKWLIKND